VSLEGFCKQLPRSVDTGFDGLGRNAKRLASRPLGQAFEGSKEKRLFQLSGQGGDCPVEAGQRDLSIVLGVWLTSDVAVVSSSVLAA
jgi:hypothetical protein